MRERETEGLEGGWDRLAREGGERVSVAQDQNEKKVSSIQPYQPCSLVRSVMVGPASVILRQVLQDPPLEQCAKKSSEYLKKFPKMMAMEEPFR